MSYSYRFPHEPEVKRTESYPLVQRFGIRFFRRMTEFWSGLFREIGARGLYMRDTMRGFAELDTIGRETIRQMRVIGVDSVPLTVIVAAFIGGVMALQTRYQLFAGVELSLVGLATRPVSTRPVSSGPSSRMMTWRVARPTSDSSTPATN